MTLFERRVRAMSARLPTWPSRRRGMTSTASGRSAWHDRLPNDRGRSALDVSKLAAEDAHLYLWATNRYVEAAFGVARAWGFRPVTLLTWCKPPNGPRQASEHCSALRGVVVRQLDRLAPADGEKTR